MQFLERLSMAARAKSSRVVFPELGEERVAIAADKLERNGICEPLGPGGDHEAHVQALVEARGMKEPIARRLLNKPLYRAAAMVALGEADAMVAGAEFSSRRVIEAASMVIGLSEGVDVSSSFFVMLFPDGREMIFADCAVNVAPSADELAAIARASAATARDLTGEARVAMLSYSTGLSGVGESVETVRAAAEATGFTGPVQGDAALNPDIARRKGTGRGDANVLIFPSLDAGNIAYKLCTELAGAQAIGPILQGFRRPVADLSRGATADDIVTATMIALALS